MKLSFKHFLYSFLALVATAFIISIPVLSSAKSDTETYRIVIEQNSEGDVTEMEVEVTGADLLNEFLALSRKVPCDHIGSFSKEFNMQEHRFIVRDDQTLQKFLDIINSSEKTFLEKHGFTLDDMEGVNGLGPALNMRYLVKKPY